MALKVSRFPETPDEPPPYKQARAAAETLAADLDKRIPTLHVLVRDGAVTAAPSQLRVDDTDVPAVAASAPQRLNPGAHVVYARHGDREGTQRVELREAESKSVTVILTGQAARAPSAPAASPHGASS